MVKIGLIAKLYTFSAGATIVASEHNSNFDVAYNEINGNLDNTNLKANAAIADSKLAQITTAAKVSGTALTLLPNTPSGAGALPNANLGNATIAPATNTADSIPQWNGANSKTLKDGLVVGTAPNNLVQLNGSSQLPAVSGALLTGIAKSQLFTSSGTFTAPAGVTTVFVTMCGAGGGGGGGADNDGGGGGGGGGAYIKKALCPVTPTSGYAVTCGTAGTAGLAHSGGGDGGNSTFVSNAATITCNGGKGGKSGSTEPPTGGAGGAASGGVGGGHSGSTGGVAGYPLTIVGSVGGEGGMDNEEGGGGGGASLGSGGAGGSTAEDGFIGYFGGGGGGGSEHGTVLVSAFVSNGCGCWVDLSFSAWP